MKPTPTDPQASSKIEIYKLLVEMADRVSQRRQSANSFYLSVNTLLVGSSAYLGDKQTTLGNLLVAIAGGSICALWLMNIWSYKTLNDAKFGVIHELEKLLPFQAFESEWQKLDPDHDGNRHKPFHKVERIVPVVFIVVYVVQAARLLPWSRILASLCTG